MAVWRKEEPGLGVSKGVKGRGEAGTAERRANRRNVSDTDTVASPLVKRAPRGPSVRGLTCSIHLTGREAGVRGTVG